jgi:hypothetical protein
MLNNFNISKILMYVAFSFITLVALIVMFVMFINPYLTISSSHDSTMQNTGNMITLLKEKISILQEVRNSRETLMVYEETLNKLVPVSASPADLVGYIDRTSKNFDFNAVDENKNVINKENDDNKVIEVRFNGKTIGSLSAINFIESLSRSTDMLLSLQNIEFFSDFENRFVRVSFNAYTPYNDTVSKVDMNSNVKNILADEKFLNTMQRYIKSSSVMNTMNQTQVQEATPTSEAPQAPANPTQ